MSPQTPAQMSDCELLKLAAKAAGYKEYYPHYLGRDSFVTYDEERYSEIKECRVVAEATKDWNPLTDDRDAFRLLAQMKMDVLFYVEGVEVCDTQNPQEIDDETVYPWAIELYINHNDNTAALRRAIVRTAAEIGRTTK